MSRDQRWALGLGLLAVAAIAGIVLRVFLGPPADVATVAVEAPADGDEQVAITFAGDTLLGDAAQQVMDTNGYDFPLRQVRTLLDTDFAIVNAEGPITRLTKPSDPTLDYSYNALPPSAQALADAGVDALGLANNHAMDRGAQGLADTRDNATTAGMSTFGADDTIETAAAPLLVSTDMGDIAVVGMGEDFGDLNRVSETQPGMTVMRDDRIRSAYFNAKAAGAEYVIAYVHWGDNYQPVNPQQRGFAKIFADAGYDMVIGTGPHIVQPIRFVNGMPVVYSLGNFMFGSPGRWDSFGAEGYGLVATVVLRADGAELQLHCIVTDNVKTGYQPQTCSQKDARTVLEDLSPDVTVKNGVGVLPLLGLTPSA